MSSKSVQIIGGPVRQHVHVDGALNALQVKVANTDAIPVVDTQTLAIHQGIAFSFTHLIETLASGEFHNILFTVTGDSVHVTFSVAASVQVIVTTHFSPTVSANGTPLTVFNHDSGSNNVAISTAFAGPTVTSPGIETSVVLIPGGGNQRAVGGTLSTTAERIAEAGTYLVRIENNSSVTAIVTTAGNWYEPGLLS